MLERPGVVRSGDPAMSADRRPGLVTPVVFAVTLTAWLLLWGWDNSSYGRSHGEAGWLRDGAVGALCSVLHGTSFAFVVTFHVVAWILMLTAMMLATTLPLLHVFRRMTRARPNGSQLIALLLAGYFIAWTLFGVVAHTADVALHSAAGRIDWLVVHGWVPGAVILSTAGVFQLSSLKKRCLDKCRSPMMFVAMHWRGAHERRSSFAIGFHHGLVCIGCCWALMLLMFVVGTASIAWMLALAAMMGAEKTLSWGKRIRIPMGVGLLSWAALIVVENL
jgi:predicted metal-binding membrane protein